MLAKRTVRLIQALIDISMHCFGIWIGIATSALASVQAFKLLNIVGLMFDLLGVVLLTIIIVTPPKARAFVINWGGVVSVAFTGLFFLGFYVGLAIGSSSWLGGKDHGLFLHFAPVVLLGLVSAFFLEDTVMIPVLRLFHDDEIRLKFLGGYFVIAGIIIQVYAAFYDLWS